MKSRTLLFLLSLAALLEAALLVASAFPDSPRIPGALPSPEDLIRWAAEADSGSGNAMESLRKEHLSCLEREWSLGLTTADDTRVCAPLRRIFATLDPDFLKSTVRDRLPAETLRENFMALALRHLAFQSGDVSEYRGREKNLGEDRWSDADEFRTDRVLESRESPEGTRTVVLSEIFEGNVLIEQALFEFMVTAREVRMGRDVVFNRPESPEGAPVGRQDDVVLLTPTSLSGNATSDGYTARIDTGSLAMPVSASSGCLIVRNWVEQFTFCPGSGLTAIEHFDFRWDLARRRFSSWNENHSLSEAELKVLRSEIVSFNKENGVREPQVLSLRRILPFSRIRERLRSFGGAPSPAGTFIRLRRGTIAVRSILSGYRDEDARNLQRRYRLIEQIWTFSRQDGKPRWTLFRRPLAEASK